MRLFKDWLARRTMLVLTSVPAFLVLLVLIGLFLRSRPILAEKPFFSLLFSPSWSPL
jgi:ABC-type phosphate transport system permease subunit